MLAGADHGSRKVWFSDLTLENRMSKALQQLLLRPGDINLLGCNF